MSFQSKGALAILCAGLLVHECVGSVAQTPQAPSAPQAPGAAENTATKIPADQLDSLVAPIALYPDPMLAQILAASTYPLELIQLQQWLQKNTNLKDKALADAVSKQPWDPSVQAMAALPDVVKRLSDDIQWTTDLGNAFLAQQSDVMDAVQRMRKKAKDSGNLKSNEQQKVETKVVESKSVVVIEQANPQVVYVPSYNPTVVYGPPVYPYPPITYPPPGYYAAGMAISFGVGVAMGAAMGGGWGWGCGWGGNNDITINTNNNFNRNTNINGGNRNQVNAVGNRSGASNTKWQHNSQHRGGAPYSDRATADRYGGTARGDSMNTRQANPRQNQNLGGRQQSAGGAAGRGQSQLQSGAVDRNRGSAGSMDPNRSPSGGDRIGNRETSGGRSSDAFGGASGGTSGASARRSSSRGASSMRGSRGGGRRR
jgi:hypothetical protein